MTTAREKINALGWTKTDPRSAYDRALFDVVELLVQDGERLQDEIEGLRTELQHIGYVQMGGEAA